YAMAVDDGVEAMAADPGNERARAAMWLATRSLGGYPATVPESFRMELKAGFEPSRVQFENIAARIGLDKISAGRGTAVFDYHNNGDGTFTNVTEKAGVQSWGAAYTASWVDYDCDGHLDLFIAYNLGGMFDRALQNRLFHNNGDGTFTDVTEKSGLQSIFTTIGSCWGDYNNDGYPDLFLSSGLGRPQLFRNNGDGTFTDVRLEAGITDPGAGPTCIFVGDNNDGWGDIVQYSRSDHDEAISTR